MPEEKLVKLTDKNRITIPKQAFDDLNLGVGDHVLVRWCQTKIEIVPVDVKPRA